jgi:predicted RNA-binding protein with PIN domain
MYIIIDGYNLLKQVIGPHIISDHERNQFIAQLGRYASQKKHQIILVFDAGPGLWPTKESKKGITIIYAGVLQSADDYIKKYIQENQHQEILLVSSDRSLVNLAGTSTVSSMKAIDFYRYLTHSETMQSPIITQPARKKNNKNQKELDELMQEGSQVIPLKNEEELKNDQERQSSAQRLSKKERALIQKIKKL